MVLALKTPFFLSLDVSVTRLKTFPTHHREISNLAYPLGDTKQQEYEEYLQGCLDQYSDEEEEYRQLCIEHERVRIERSLLQPQSVYNYTTLGFAKIKAPKTAFELLQKFWNDNRDKATEEAWTPGRTEVNHWKVHSKMVSVEDYSLDGAGDLLKVQVWNEIRDTLQEWTGQRLAECSLYGIRIYQEGAVLATHVDRLPLVSSAIINIDQDVDEPWQLEVIGHDGKAHNVTMVGSKTRE